MKLVYKEELKFNKNNGTECFLTLNTNKILKIGVQGDKIVAWYVYDRMKISYYNFKAVTTGYDEVPGEPWSYYDTVQLEHGLVYHIFIHKE